MGCCKQKNIIDAVRSAMRDRALYLLFIKRQLEREGIDNIEKILSKAIYMYGKYKVRDKDLSTPAKFFENVYDSVSVSVMEAEILEKGEKRLNLKECYCPLYEAWKEAGCSVSEIKQLCRIADWVDKAMVEDFPIKVKFGGNMQEKGEYCQMIIESEEER